MSGTFEAKVRKLCALGVSEDKARHALTKSARERRLSQDIVVGGAFALADEMPETDFVLRPIAVRGQFGTITAHPGHGKSTVSGSIAVAFVLDRPLGPIHPVGTGLVYFVSAEDVQGTANRLRAEAVRYRLSPEDRAALDERLRWVHVNALMRPESILDAIRVDAEGRDVALVLIDTGPATFVAEDENDNAAMQDFAMAWRRGTELSGNPCVLVMTHPTKNATTDGLVPRGGSALSGSIDCNLTLWRDDDVVTLGHGKLRAEHFEPMRFRLEPVPLVLASGAHLNIPVAVPITDAAAEAAERGLTERREAILTAMLDAPGALGLRDITRRACGDDRRKTSVARDLDDLARGPRALIERDQVAGGFALTPAGRRFAESIRKRSEVAYREASDGR